MQLFLFKKADTAFWVSRYEREEVIPANSRRSISVGLPLAQRRRRWANGKPTLVERLVFSWMLTEETVVFAPVCT